MKNGKESVTYLQRFGIAVVISALITVIMLFLGAFLMLKANLPEKTVDYLVPAMYLVPTICGGFYVGKKTDRRKFLWGVLFGVIFAVIHMLIALTWSTDTYPGRMIQCFVTMIIGGMAGGMLSGMR